MILTIVIDFYGRQGINNIVQYCSFLSIVTKEGFLSDYMVKVTDTRREEFLRKLNSVNSLLIMTQSIIMDELLIYWESLMRLSLPRVSLFSNMLRFISPTNSSDSVNFITT